jgi:hypothetical protein
MRRLALFPFLVALTLGAGEPDLQVDLRTALGQDPATRIVLVPAGAWYGLLLSSRLPDRPALPHRGHPGATVEVLDFLPPGDARSEALASFVLDLRQRLVEAFKSPPPDNASVDLGIFMATDPSHPETLGPALVRSLQDRFNRPPPGMAPATGR